MPDEKVAQDEDNFRRAFNNRSYVACTRCRSQKIKCSGENPCRNCHRSKTLVECVYPVRNRKVAVPENYLRNLQAELKAAKRANTERAPILAADLSAEASSPDLAVAPRREAGSSIRADATVDPSQPDERSSQSLYIGEAACTRFGYRLLKLLGGDDQISSTRQDRFFSDQILERGPLQRMTCADYELPNRAYGRLLVRTYLQFMGADFHFIPRKRFLKRMDETYDSPSSPQDPVWLCKLFAVFALGELYSSRTNHDKSVPGTVFFLKAMSFLQDLYEETTVEYVETLVLLSFYSQALNRKNTAYTYAGLALRISLALGLHRKIPADSSLSPVDREGRIRSWWTVYCLDRLFSSKLGHPVMLRDEDIDVQLPSMDGLSSTEQEEFFDPEYMLAHIALSRITGDIINELCQIPQRGQPTPNRIEQSVQRILTTLKQWQTNLPAQAKVDFRASPIYPIRTAASLHLHFGQCVILTTRPIFFQIFRSAYQTAALPAATQQTRQPSMIALALADACVQAARASNVVLTQLWIDRCLATFGFFDALSLFSTTMILMMASALRPSTDTTDDEAIETAWNLLKSMADEGNVPARGYYELLMELQTIFTATRGKNNVALDLPSISEQQTVPQMRSENNFENMQMQSSVENMLIQQTDPLTYVQGRETWGDGLLDNPYLQDFLNQDQFGRAWQIDFDFNNGFGPWNQWNSG